MKYKYIPIGALVQYGQVILKACPTPSNAPICAKCYFSKHYCRVHHIKEKTCYTHGMLCTASRRKDKQHVVFIKQE